MNPSETRMLKTFLAQLGVFMLVFITVDLGLALIEMMIKGEATQGLTFGTFVKFVIGFILAHKAGHGFGRWYYSKRYPEERYPFDPPERK